MTTALSSEAGALLLGRADEAIGLVDRLAGCFRDERHQDPIVHSVRTLIGRYHKIHPNSAATESLFVDIFLDAHRSALQEIVLELDATDDRQHGHQAAPLEHRWSGRSTRGTRADHRPDPRALARGAHHPARRFRILSRRANELVFGFARNARLSRAIGAELQAAAVESAKTRRAARCFKELGYSDVVADL